MTETASKRFPRKRARDIGLKFGHFKTGRYNAITDVKGVKIGHCTVIDGDGRIGEKTVRTGVTAILPSEGEIYYESVSAGAFVLNGAGEVSGLTQVQEWDLIETPIILTNTFSVGIGANSVVQYMAARHPEISKQSDVIIPLVGECDDSWLNDIVGQHIKTHHVYEAITNARSGPVEEGAVGGGTGMITCDFKSGIGTASRKLADEDGGFTIGVLVMSNFGEMKDLRISGVPIGPMLDPYYKHLPRRRDNYGSIIVVVATDAPLLGHQLDRLAKRAALGVGRCGSYAAHGSGEIILAFSTSNKVARGIDKMYYKMKILLNHRMNPLYEAVIEATEEAIVNSICMAEPMIGVNGHYSPALPLEKVRKIFKNFDQIVSNFNP